MHTSNRAEDVIELLAGTVTVSDVAARHGTTAEEVEAWKALYLHALAGKRRAGISLQPRSRMLAAFVAVALVGGGLFAARTAWAQVACTYPGLNGGLRAMCPDSPALADEVNFNNKKLTDFIEQKVGVVGSPDVRITSTSSTPLSAVGNLLAGDTNTGGVEFRHTNGTQGIGFGYNTIYATGGAPNQALQLKAKGNELVRSLSDFAVGGNTTLNNTTINGDLTVTGNITSVNNNSSDCYDTGYVCANAACAAGYYMTGMDVRTNENCGGGGNDLDYGDYRLRCCRL